MFEGERLEERSVGGKTYHDLVAFQREVDTLINPSILAHGHAHRNGTSLCCIRILRRLIRSGNSKRQVNGRHKARRESIHLLCLANLDLCHVMLTIPRVTHLKGWIATLIDPLLEELRQAAARRLLKCAFQVCRYHFAGAIAFKIRLDAAPECRLAKLVTQHVQYPATLLIHVPVKKLLAILVKDIIDDGAAMTAIFLQVNLFLAEHLLLERILTLVMLHP